MYFGGKLPDSLAILYALLFEYPYYEFALLWPVKLILRIFSSIHFRRCSNLHLKCMGGEVTARETLLHRHCEFEHVLTCLRISRGAEGGPAEMEAFQP